MTVIVLWLVAVALLIFGLLASSAAGRMYESGDPADKRYSFPVFVVGCLLAALAVAIMAVA